MGIRVTLWMTVLALWTTSVVAPIPGLSSLPSLSDIFSAGVEETTPDPTASDSTQGGAGAAGAAAGAGSFAFDKGIHLGDPKFASLDANLNVTGAKSFGVSGTKGGIVEFPTTTTTPRPPPPPPPPHNPPPPPPPPPHSPPPPPPPPHYPPPYKYQQREGHHYNVHNPGNRPHY